MKQINKKIKKELKEKYNIGYTDVVKVYPINFDVLKHIKSLYKEDIISYLGNIKIIDSAPIIYNYRKNDLINLFVKLIDNPCIIQIRYTWEEYIDWFNNTSLKERKIKLKEANNEY